MLGCVVEAPDRLTAYFANGAGDPCAGMRLPAGAREVGRERIGDEDWLEQYRRSVRPLRVGETWLLDPRDVGSEDRVADERTTLLLPARRAFGTGGHESTRLALRLIETTDLAGRCVLDLGYGSGVLAFAAAHRGATRCLAIEHDLTAALVGGLNRALNPTPVPVTMVAGGVDALNPGSMIDVLLVNARPQSWLPGAPGLDRSLVAGGTVLCSGMLATECDDVAAAVAEFGWTVIDKIDENDWRALRMRVDR